MRNATRMISIALAGSILFAAGPIHVMILDGESGGTYHNWQLITPVLKKMLDETHVAATPGVDFDPVRGKHFIRFCYAGSHEDMHEAVARIARWLK